MTPSPKKAMILQLGCLAMLSLGGRALAQEQAQPSVPQQQTAPAQQQGTTIPNQQRAPPQQAGTPPRQTKPVPAIADGAAPADRQSVEKSSSTPAVIPPPPPAPARALEEKRLALAELNRVYSDKRALLDQEEDARRRALITSPDWERMGFFKRRARLTKLRKEFKGRADALLRDFEAERAQLGAVAPNP